jgi:hypothetical protein
VAGVVTFFEAFRHIIIISISSGCGISSSSSRSSMITSNTLNPLINNNWIRLFEATRTPFPIIGQLTELHWIVSYFVFFFFVSCCMHVMSQYVIIIPFKAEAETSAPSPHMFSVKNHSPRETKYSDAV